MAEPKAMKNAENGDHTGADCLQISVVRQVTYLVVPFAYEQEYPVARTNVNEKLWTGEDQSKNRLFDHIDRLICQEDRHETIGKRYVLSQSGRTAYGLPKNRTARLNVSTKHQTFDITVENVELYLFETCVGILAFEIGYLDGVSIETVINGNYFLKKFKQDVIWNFMERHSQTEEIRKQTTLDALTEKMLEAFDVSTYFEKGSKLPDHALVYNAALLPDTFTQEESWEDKLKEYIFRMRRSFKESYRPSPAEFDVKNNPEILQLFENSYWGVSLEGLANIVYGVDNETTNTYFTGTYYGNLKTTYFYMYLLSLHQRYTLLHLSILASKLPTSLQEAVNVQDDDINQDDAIPDLMQKIIFFTLRGAFKHISNITHHSILYERMCRTLQIDSLMKELHFELDVLSSATTLHEDRQRKRRQEKEDDHKKRTENYVFIASLLFVLTSVLADGWSLIYNGFNEGQLMSANCSTITTYILFVALVIGVGYYSIRMKVTD